jgi:hypothetical protein
MIYLSDLVLPPSEDVPACLPLLYGSYVILGQIERNDLMLPMMTPRAVRSSR